jgi:hypothetical protein
MTEMTEMIEDTKQVKHDGRNDFDFLIGEWTSHQWRLRERLKGSQSWEEFESTSVVRKVLGGLGKLDEVTMIRESGVFRGVTLRLFNPETQQWSIYWADSTGNGLGAPMVGEFTQGRGVFYDCEPFEGKRIFSRFIWTHDSPDSCRWEQAFSADGGATWETNWIMESTRIQK